MSERFRQLGHRSILTAAQIARPRTIRVEYLVQAAPRSVVRGRTWPLPGDDDGPTAGTPAWAWRLTDDAGTELARGTLEAAGGEAADDGRSR